MLRSLRHCMQAQKAKDITPPIARRKEESKAEALDDIFRKGHRQSDEHRTVSKAMLGKRLRDTVILV